jgi:hypothetical protein
MSKRNRQRRKARRESNQGNLEGLAVVMGLTLLPGGGKAPFVRPLVEWGEPWEFDKEVCQRGLKVFSRPLASADFPLETEKYVRGMNAILVREVSPGIRVRQAIARVVPRNN